MGRASQAILLSVLVTNVLHLGSSILNGTRTGFTWRKRRAPTSAPDRGWSVSVLPRDDMNGVVLGAVGAW
jgi:hypothetical protein